MAVTVGRRRELTFWEKLYVPRILCGLKITFAHFLRNLFLHTGHLLGRFENLSASATILFQIFLCAQLERHATEAEEHLRSHGHINRRFVCQALASAS